MTLTARTAHLLLVCGVAGAVYGNALTFGFVWDDRVLLLANESIRSMDLVSIWTDIPNRIEFQPVRDTLHALLSAGFGFDPRAFHALSVCVYLANLSVIYLFTFRLLDRTRLTRELCVRDQNRLLALATTLIFAVHPLHSENVSFVMSLNSLLSATFLFLACYGFLLVMDATGARRARLAALIMLSFIVSLLSKASSIVLPLLLALIVIVSTGDAKRDKQVWYLIALSLGVSLLAFLGFSRIASNAGLTGVGHAIEFTNAGLVTRGVISVQIVLFYLVSVFRPIGLTVEYAPDFVTQAFAFKTVLAAAVVGALA